MAWRLRFTSKYPTKSGRYENGLDQRKVFELRQRVNHLLSEIGQDKDRHAGRQVTTTKKKKKVTEDHPILVLLLRLRQATVHMSLIERVRILVSKSVGYTSMKAIFKLSLFQDINPEMFVSDGFPDGTYIERRMSAISLHETDEDPFSEGLANTGDPRSRALKSIFSVDFKSAKVCGHFN